MQLIESAQPIDNHSDGTRLYRLAIERLSADLINDETLRENFDIDTVRPNHLLADGNCCSGCGCA